MAAFFIGSRNSKDIVTARQLVMDEEEFDEHPADDMSQYQDYPYEFDY